MSDWDDEIAAANDAGFAEFARVCTYRPQRGAGDPVTVLANLRASDTVQSSAPGYFGDVEVRESQVSSPELGDVVVWTDETIYTVSRRRRGPRGNWLLSLHRKDG